MVRGELQRAVGVAEADLDLLEDRRQVTQVGGGPPATKRHVGPQDDRLDPLPVRCLGERENRVRSPELDGGLIQLALAEQRCCLLAQPFRPLHQRPRLDARRLRPALAQPNLLAEALAQQARGPQGGGILCGEELPGRQLEARPLDIHPTGAVHQPYRHTQLIACSLDGSHDQASGFQGPRDAVGWQRALSIWGHAVARDHVQGANLGESPDQGLREAVGEVRQLAVRAEILEVEHRHVLGVQPTGRHR